MTQKEHCVTNNAISSRLLTSHSHNFAMGEIKKWWSHFCSWFYGLLSFVIVSHKKHSGSVKVLHTKVWKRLICQLSCKISCGWLSDCIFKSYPLKCRRTESSFLSVCVTHGCQHRTHMAHALSSPFYSSLHFITLFFCLGAWVWLACHGMHAEVKEQLEGAGFLFPLCGSWGSSMPSAWAVWSTEPNQWSNVLLFNVHIFY